MIADYLVITIRVFFSAGFWSGNGMEVIGKIGKINDKSIKGHAQDNIEAAIQSETLEE